MKWMSWGNNMNILVSICQSVTRCPPERSEGVGTCNQPWSSPSPHLQNEQSAVLQWPVTSTAIGARQGHPLQTRQCVAMVALSSAVVLPLQCHYLLVNALQWLPWVLQWYCYSNATTSWSMHGNGNGCLEFYSGTAMPLPPGHHPESGGTHHRDWLKSFELFSVTWESTFIRFRRISKVDKI